MSDTLAGKIAQLEAMRQVLGDVAVEAAIAALHAEATNASVDSDAATTAPPSLQQGIRSGDRSRIVKPVQVSADGDALVLRDITIGEGGTLIVGGSPDDLPPKPEEIQRALGTYLRTLLERYQFLSLQGLGAGANRQLLVRLRAVFINLHTDIQLAETAALFGDTPEFAARLGNAPQQRSPRRRGATKQPAALSADLRQWLDELLTAEERNALLGQAKAKANSKEVDLDAVRERLQAPRTALELIRHHRALVLLGDPGSGKTTVLRHLALGFAFARLHADQPEAVLDAPLAWTGPLPLPVLVQLRNFANELEKPPQDAGPLLAHIEHKLSGDRLDALAQHLTTRLDAGSVLVLLDGLDEVADPQRRTWVARAATLFQTRFPHSRLVLTSRRYAYREPCTLPPPFQVATLQPLDAAAQDDFIHRWYQAALLQGSGLSEAEQEQAAATRARDLTDALDRRQRLREIGGNPLLLTMIALVHQHRYRLPQQRARLYEECLLLLLEQWEQHSAEGRGLVATLGVPDQTDRLALVQPLAYQLQALGREEAGQEEVKDWLLRRFVSLTRGDASQAEALIEQLLSFLEGRSGLLIARDVRDSYAFPHRTFQEYLAARELIYQGSKRVLDEVLARRHESAWREVILLTVGHYVASGFPQEAKALGWKLLQADPAGSAASYRSAVLAGELVEELGDVLEGDGLYLKQDVVRALVALVEGGHLPAGERVEAAFLLGRLGDPRLPTPAQPAYWCEIAAGTFWSGDDREKQPLRQMQLDYDFKIARHSVTNAEYQRFMDDGGYEFDQPWWTENGRQWMQQNRRIEPSFWRDSRYCAPTQPVVGVTWYEATAYCRWLSLRGHEQGWLPADVELRLPTWLEWECAARHTDQRRYPWGGEQPDPERTNYRDTKIGRPAPVGCFPRGVAVCGAHDMVGNVWEWTATPYGKPDQLRAAKDFTTDDGVLFAYNDYSDDGERLCCGARNRRPDQQGLLRVLSGDLVQALIGIRLLDAEFWFLGSGFLGSGGSKGASPLGRAQRGSL